jgi:hypothetical protein
MPISTSRCRTMFGTMITAGAAIAAAVALASPAGAYQPQTTTSCSSLKFMAPWVHVVVHTTESKASGSQLTALVDALDDINATIAKVGGSAATAYSVTTTTTAFTQGKFVGDFAPTIHVGFSGSLADGVGGSTVHGPVGANCTYNEAQITLPDFDSTVKSVDSNGTVLATWNLWNLGTPGTGYYDASIADSSNALYLRPIYLHELLHALGLHHVGDEFAMLNYGTKAWANRSPELMMAPLPDDIAGLRALYPWPTTRYEVAVLNNWYTAASDPRTPAADARLCAPSLGDKLSSDKFAQYCGDGGPQGQSTTVCAGDLLKVRATIANYSTSTAIVTKQLWFSNDLTWQEADAVSSGSHTDDVPAGHSVLYGMTFTVPTLVGGAKHVILRVISQSDSNGDGVTEGDTVSSDWIPLRGTVTPC